MGKQEVLSQMKSGQGFIPSRPEDRQLRAEGQPPVLPNHNQVLLQHAIKQTQARMAEVDRLWEKAEATVLEYYDQRSERAKANIAESILKRMGIDLATPAAADFFDQGQIDIQAAFDKLLPSAPALPQGGGR